MIRLSNYGYQGRLLIPIHGKSISNNFLACDVALTNENDCSRCENDGLVF